MDISLTVRLHSKVHALEANKFCEYSIYPGYKGTITTDHIKSILISNWHDTERLKLYYSSLHDTDRGDTPCSLNIFKYLL